MSRAAADCTPVPSLVPIGGRFDLGAVPDADGLLVCGGPPSPHGRPSSGAGCSTVSRCPRRTRRRASKRSPYGRSWGSRPSPWTCTRRSGGTLPRLIAGVARHGLPHGVAVDENTLVEVAADGRAQVSGRGRAHSVRPAPDGGGVLVRSFGAGESFLTH
ncbi:hypothetical protein [Streptomyces sp. NPDC050548]|uniref:hypothetical protein n=1 Tax=Streptomyces sp. NPDC050548 TaxID=3365629 RepID=UPI00379F6848